MPKVSVLLPVKDGAPFLEACLASLAGQTLADHEIIAVDDGSTDGSREILERCARADPRLLVLENPGLGVVDALNAALAAAAGPFAARMDGDDVAHPERLAAQVERLEADPRVAILGCRVRLVGGLPRGNAGMRAYVAWINTLMDHDAIVRDLWVESPLAHPSVMMRAEAVRRLGGYRVFHGPEDYDLWLRAHAAGLRFGKCPGVLLDWRDSAGRLSRTDPRYSLGSFRALKIEALLGDFLAGERPIVIWGAGPIGKAWSRELTAAGRPAAAFVEVDPNKIGHAIHGAPVLPVGRAASVEGALHLAAVSGAAARERIRSEAGRLGLVDGKDFLAVA
ncbi:MAG: glycosyltransferase family 2 protein [Vicinamibacteria bacterium]